MQIPFGSRQPNEQEKELLLKLGFNLNEIEQTGRYYFLNIPKNPRIRCEKLPKDQQSQSYSIYYNDTRVITINQKTTFQDATVSFNFGTSSVIEAALEKNKEISDEEAKKISEYQANLVKYIIDLEMVVFNGGAQRGWADKIRPILSKLNYLNGENPTAHDVLIESNQRYKKVLDLFPGWIDVNNLEPQYKSMDINPWGALASTFRY